MIMPHVPESAAFDAEVLYVLGTTPSITLTEVQHRLGLPKAANIERIKQSFYRLHNQRHITGEQLSRLVRNTEKD